MGMDGSKLFTSTSHEDFVCPTVRLKADKQDRVKLVPAPVVVEDLSSKQARESTDLR